MKLIRTVDLQRPAAEVFEYLSDFTTTTEWDPGTVETVRISGDGGVGTAYRNRSRFNGRETELVYTVIDLVPGQLIRLRGENKTVTATDTIEVAATEQGCRVRYEADFKFRGIAAVAVPFLGRAFRTLGDEAAEGLRRVFAK